jgi:hypothetical protein
MIDSLDICELFFRFCEQSYFQWYLSFHYRFLLPLQTPLFPYRIVLDAKTFFVLDVAPCTLKSSLVLAPQLSLGGATGSDSMLALVAPLPCLAGPAGPTLATMSSPFWAAAGCRPRAARTKLAMSQRPEAVMLLQEAKVLSELDSAGVFVHARESDAVTPSPSGRAKRSSLLALCLAAVWVSSQAWAIFSMLGLIAGLVLARTPLDASAGKRQSALTENTAGEGENDIENLRRRIALLEQCVYVEQAVPKAAEADVDEGAEQRVRGKEESAKARDPDALELVAQWKSFSQLQRQHFLDQLSAEEKQELLAGVRRATEFSQAKPQAPRNDFARWQESDVAKLQDHPHYSSRMRERILFLWGQSGLKWFGLREEQARPELDLSRHSDEFLERHKRFLDLTYRTSDDDDDLLSADLKQ